MVGLEQAGMACSFIICLGKNHLKWPFNHMVPNPGSRPSQWIVNKEGLVLTRLDFLHRARLIDKSVKHWTNDIVAIALEERAWEGVCDQVRFELVG